MADKRKDPLLFPIINDRKRVGYMISWVRPDGEELDSSNVTVVDNGKDLDLVLEGYYRG